MRKSAIAIRLLTQSVMFLTSWAFLKFLAQQSYDHFLPGVPDTGRWPVSSLVWLLLQDFVPGRVWADFPNAAVWLPALAMLALPTLLVSMFANSHASRRLAWGLSGGLILWEAYAVYEMQSSYVRLFHLPERPIEVIWWIVMPMLWVVGTCAFGRFLGILLRKRIDAKEVAMTTFGSVRVMPN